MNKINYINIWDICKIKLNKVNYINIWDICRIKLNKVNYINIWDICRIKLNKVSYPDFDYIDIWDIWDICRIKLNKITIQTLITSTFKESEYEYHQSITQTIHFFSLSYPLLSY